jgi:hypothetical protein
MQTQLLSRTDKVMLGLAVWLCTLPLAFAVAVLFNLQAGVVTALGLLFGITALCWVLCSAQLMRRHLRRH